MKKFKIVSLALITIVLLAITPTLINTQNEPSLGDAVVDNTISGTKALNSVTAVVFDFRGYDTLGEATVLFTAILATATVLRKTKKKGEQK